MSKRATPVKRLESRLQPNRPVVIVQGDKVVSVGPDEASAERIGLKAWGMASIPEIWTKPFFVVNGDKSPSPQALKVALKGIQVQDSMIVLVRSNGSNEGLYRRGDLDSVECQADRLEATLNILRKRFPEESQLHWVVQGAIRSSIKGHLANERRVAQDKRDWVVELEASPGYPAERHAIALRTWRDNRIPPVRKLSCAYKEQIVQTLQEVARWTYERLIRVHFEWVWDGQTVYLVQADSCDEVSGGQDPRSLIGSIVNLSDIDGKLKVFRRASPLDFQNYRKLANAKTYEELGYSLVPFYVLDDQSVLEKLLNDSDTDAGLLADLDVLTKRALVIRTDGQAIPSIQRQMLPRSDELRTRDAARKWLLGKFREQILKADGSGQSLANAKLCLIAHHFVPAASSAWCKASPDTRRVRIESLWGIPEGLYWYSYDVFDVDTKSMTAESREARPKNINFREKRRYKRRFIAPDESGNWIVHSTSEIADWARSISREDWIRDIAWTSRCIASKERKSVVVMWFIDTHPDATGHAVLPWYHEEWKQHQVSPKAAPKKHIDSGVQIKIQSKLDWNNLTRQVADEKQLISRIEIDPAEEEILRDRDFVDRVAAFAKAKGISIRLSGGILSHAYYILTRAGCDVECEDLDAFAFEEDAVQFNKLVRDGIPRSISEKGESVSVIYLRGAARMEALRRKLIEECFEVFDAQTNDEIKEEIADVVEVLFAIMGEMKISRRAVEDARKEKADMRGAFKDGVMLRKTTIMSPLALKSMDADLVGGSGDERDVVVEKVIDLPIGDQEDLHVDARHDQEGVAQRQLTSVSPVHGWGVKSSRATFNLETPDRQPHEITAAISIDREGSNLRVKIRLINAPKQLDLPI